MKFAIAAWRAVSPYHHEEHDWRLWVKQGQSLVDLSQKEGWDLSFLPVMKRRRLSMAARQAFAAAWPLVPEPSACPIVFVSHDGEVNRSFQLWRDLLSDEGVSPTSFALSVHNAIVGQWSLLRHDMSESVAVCARENGLEIGIVEACGLLSEGEAQVLVVVVEEPIKDDDVQAVKAPFPFALALLLTQGEDCCLSYQPAEEQADHEHVYYSSSLHWITQQIGQQKSWQQPAAAGYWDWQMTHAHT